MAKHDVSNIFMFGQLFHVKIVIVHKNWENKKMYLCF